jgi:hypothetical protein
LSLLALKEAMKKKEINHLKKFYVQFDNAAVNKSWSVIIALCILVATGIVDKVVIAFLLVGHTHTDVDRIISYVVSFLRNMDIPTLDKLKEYVLQSFNPKVCILIYYMTLCVLIFYYSQINGMLLPRLLFLNKLSL